MPAKEGPGGGSFGAASAVMQVGGGLVFAHGLFTKGAGAEIGIGGALFITGVGLGIANMKK